MVYEWVCVCGKHVKCRDTYSLLFIFLNTLGENSNKEKPGICFRCLLCLEGFDGNWNLWVFEVWWWKLKVVINLQQLLLLCGSNVTLFPFIAIWAGPHHAACGIGHLRRAVPANTMHACIVVFLLLCSTTPMRRAFASALRGHFALACFGVHVEL